jgi:hypothetical protein
LPVLGRQEGWRRGWERGWWLAVIIVVAVKVLWSVKKTNELKKTYRKGQRTLAGPWGWSERAVVVIVAVG